MRRKNPFLEDDTEDQILKDRFLAWAERWINWAGALLVLAFGWLVIRDIEANKVITPLAIDFLWRAALVVYYIAWVRGTKNDTRIQALALETLPGKGQITLDALCALAILVTVAAALLWSKGSMIWFSLVLVLFVATDHGLWWFWLRPKYLRDSYLKSRRSFIAKKKYFRLELLQTVEEQVFGKWKFYRLGVGILILVVLNVFTFVVPVQIVVVRVVMVFASWLKEPEAALFIYTLLIVAFILVMEGAHWYVRMRTKARIDELGKLSSRYDLVPRTLKESV